MHNIPNKPRFHPTLPTPSLHINPNIHLHPKPKKTTPLHPHNKPHPTNIHNRQDKHKTNITTLIKYKYK